MPDKPPTVRTFLAVAVSPPIHAALVELKSELAHSGAGVRWVRDEGLHATVKFLGSVPEATLPAIRDALQDALGLTPAPHAIVQGLGMFPNRKRPRVIWVDLDCQPLTTIAARVDHLLEPFGFAPERRAFHPHITLGRVNTMQNWSALAARLDARDGERFGDCVLDGLIGYRSDLRREGSVYTKLWTIRFGG